MSPPTFDPFVSSDSWLHRRDPRAKLGTTFLLLLAVALIPDGGWLTFALWAVFVLLLAQAGHIPLRALLRRSLLALPFVLGALALPFAVPGKVVVRVPNLGWPLTEPGLVQAGSLILRAWVSVLLFATLTACTRIGDLLWSLEALRVPSVVVAVMEFAFRYLSISIEEWADMLRARRARTVNPRGRGVPLRRQLISAGGMLGTLILRGLDRGERVHAAMVARGYDGGIRRMTRFRFSSLDLLLPITGVLILLVVWLI